MRASTKLKLAFWGVVFIGLDWLVFHLSSTVGVVAGIVLVITFAIVALGMASDDDIRCWVKDAHEEAEEHEQIAANIRTQCAQAGYAPFMAPRLAIADEHERKARELRSRWSFAEYV